MDVWRRLCSLVCLVAWLTFSESITFTQEPQANVTTRFGQSVWLHWKFVLEGKETLVQSSVFFKNSTMIKFVPIANGVRRLPEPEFSKVKTYPGLNFSIAIVNVDYSYNGNYYFEVTVTNPLYRRLSRNVFLTVEEFVRFTQEPPANLTTNLGQSVWLHWNYALRGAETLIQNEILFKRNTVNKFARLASGRNIVPAAGFSKIKTYASNVSIAIISIDYSYTGIYYFQLILSNPLSIIVSHNVTITVKGKPVFCDGFPNATIKKEEGGTQAINISLCSVPKPTLNYKWNDGVVRNIGSSLAKGSFQYASSFTLTNLQRNRCGRNVTYYATNSVGKSLEQQIKVEILFKPAKLTGLYAYFVNDKRVKVEWNKQESGMCNIDYRVDFLNSVKQVVGTKFGQNIVTVSLDDITPDKVATVRIMVKTAQGSLFESHQVSRQSPRDKYTFVSFNLWHFPHPFNWHFRNLISFKHSSYVAKLLPFLT